MATPYRYFAPEIALLPGTHRFDWGMVAGDELRDLQEIGVRIFALDQSLRATMAQVHSTIQVCINHSDTPNF